MAPSAAIIVFVRLPVPGQVKTRLAAGVGPGAACQFYKLCAQHVLNVCALLGDECTLVVQHSCNDSTQDVQQWVDGLQLQQTCSLNAHVLVLPQSSDPDLGAKMQHAMDAQLQQPGIHKVLIVGSDIPDLNVDVLRAALHKLDNCEVVLGPAGDGGYYLMGLTRMIPQLFQGIPWSTSVVLQRTLEAATAAGACVCPQGALPTLQDIDTVSDLQAWYQTAQQSMQASEHSMDVAHQGQTVPHQMNHSHSQIKDSVGNEDQVQLAGVALRIDQGVSMALHGYAPQESSTCSTQHQARSHVEDVNCVDRGQDAIVASRQLLVEFVSRLLQQTS